MAEREIRVVVLRFYSSTSAREKQHPNPVILKTAVMLVQENIQHPESSVQTLKQVKN